MYVAKLLVLALAVAGNPAPRARHAADYDRALLGELETSAPAAVDEARAASEAFRAEKWQECIERYGRVLAVAPTFSHALRRQCTARLELGDRDAAISLCRQAVAIAALPENRGALARALAFQKGEGQSPVADRREATLLAGAVLAASPDDVILAQQACGVALQLRDETLIRSCSDTLLRSAPDDLGTQYFAIIAALTREQYQQARQHLARARAAGLPPAQADRMDRLIGESEPAYLRHGRPALVIAVTWSAGLLILLALGAALSKVTLRAAVRMASAPPEARDAAPALLRRLYGVVLGLCCGYYYVSVPLVLVAVVALGGGALYGLLALGRVPVKLLLILGLVVVVTVWAVLKALWVSVFRPPDTDPGERLEHGANPHLDELLRQVAERIGTRPVDTVFLTPGTDVAVFERGSLLQQLSGRAERCLILGVGVLEGMTQGELKAVLAHEYGHLVNRDTAGGGLALAVRRSVRQMGVTLARGGAATWYNPAWWFVQGFHRIFLRVSQGASRLQEILADRWAALAYGGTHFARGLRHVIERSIRFDRHAQASLGEVIEGRRALANLYRYQPGTAIDESSVAAAVEQALGAEPSPYDSHPRPNDRIAWVGGLVAEASRPEDEAAAWELFFDREGVERLMTDQVRASIERSHGVAIPVEQPAAEPSAAP
jgi:Zn-dependent protease with chaperone function